MGKVKELNVLPCVFSPGGLKLTLGKDVQVILGVQTSLGLIRFG